MNSTKASKRILALDILRGVTIAGMIMVNNPGSWGHIYAPLAACRVERSDPPPTSSFPSSCLSWEFPHTFP